MLARDRAPYPETSPKLGSLHAILLWPKIRTCSLSLLLLLLLAPNSNYPTPSRNSHPSFLPAPLHIVFLQKPALLQLLLRLINESLSIFISTSLPPFPPLPIRKTHTISSTSPPYLISFPPSPLACSPFSPSPIQCLHPITPTHLPTSSPPLFLPIQINSSSRSDKHHSFHQDPVFSHQ